MTIETILKSYLSELINIYEIFVTRTFRGTDGFYLQYNFMNSYDILLCSSNIKNHSYFLWNFGYVMEKKVRGINT